jgi:GDP-L-fucose synthase
MLWQAHHSLPIAVHKGTERCFTWVRDSCEGMAIIAESGQAGTWNVCRDDDRVQMTDLARRCVDLVPGSTSEIIEADPGDQVTLRKRLDSTRLYQLGWKPKVSLDEGMRETLGYVSRYGKDERWEG